MRKTLDWTVEDANRDEGKVFRVTELPASEAEDWAIQAFFALLNAGVEVPDDVVNMGFAGIASIGLSALGKVPYEQAKPLFAKMMTCVQIVPDASKPTVVRGLIESDIEEIQTRMKLRKMVFGLHWDFSQAAIK
jgi:hypothetical protein